MKPNIVFIQAESLDGRALGYMQEPGAHTPNIDRLAQNGTVFENAYCNSPQCVPSRSSMWSGRYVHQAAAYNNFRGLPNNERTFVHDLEKAGYTCSIQGRTDHRIGFHNLKGRLATWARTIPDPDGDGNGEPRARGLVVNMIDQRVRKLTPDFMTYTIAKMGLWALTRTAAQALAPRVRVNAIGPGPTLKGHRQSADHFARQRAATVLGRGADEDDITAALAYLLHAPAVTGQLICVDGGQHLGWRTPDVLGPE